MQEGSLYDVENVALVHHVNQALRAHKLFQRDRDYIVKDNEVIIIDEFTGRMMPGRRFSEGLHQALEAKEARAHPAENQTLASITFQNYFRLYDKLAGMTGTAATEADEFMDIYKLDVVEIPTNVPVQRIDEDDEVYRTVREKFAAIVEEIKDAQQRGQPVLVGTTSIEKSEMLAAFLKERAFRTRCSTPATTSRKRRSSPRPACRARSPLPPTWPAAAPTSSLAATPKCASPPNSPDVPEGKKRDAAIQKITTRSPRRRNRRLMPAACS
jgi:hypothetical protein